MKNRLKKRRIYKRCQSRHVRWRAEDRAWLDVIPVGREFGSQDDERLRQLDILADAVAQRGLIQFWVRHLVRREGSSFFLQKADGRFYPDFLCQLPGAEDQPRPVLTVEYREADCWNGAEDDRLIGGLWANLSEGRCRFVIAKDKRWDWIEPLLT